MAAARAQQKPRVLNLDRALGGLLVFCISSVICGALHVTPVKPARYFYPAVSSLVLPQWQEEWDSERSNGLREPKSTLKGWSSSSQRNRHEVAFCRLHIGHVWAARALSAGRGEASVLPLSCALYLRSCLLRCPRRSHSRGRHPGCISPGTTLSDFIVEDSDWIQTGCLFSYIPDVIFL